MQSFGQSRKNSTKSYVDKPLEIDENIPYSKKELLGRGKVRSFQWESLKQIAFPLGGIGTGTVSLGGRGNLTDWEIFNRPGKGKILPMTFFSLWAKEQGKPAVTKVLEREILPPFTGAHGLEWWLAGGLPRFSNVKFTGEYPFATIEFSDETVPLKVTLEAFNPFIPLNDRDSGLPVAILRYRLKNEQQKPVETSVVGSVFNIIGYNGLGPIATPKWPVFDRIYPKFEQNINEMVNEGIITGLRMTSRKYQENDPRFGSICLATAGKNITYTPYWDRERLLYNRLRVFWDDFSDDGKLNPAEESLSPDGETDIGSLGSFGTIPPGEEIAFTFVISWYFPTRVLDWEGGMRKDLGNYGIKLRNYYATLFTDAWDVARYTLNNLERLETETRTFHDALFESTLPWYVLDAVSSQASIIKTNTCFRTEDGRLHGFEGCGPEKGSCPMDCTHVWNYEQSIAHLFPALERTMRRTDSLNNTSESGFMSHRTVLPLGNGDCKRPAAADGQMGCIIKLYREWQLSGDTEFLRELWPWAKKAIEYAWKTWDADQDGVMEGKHQLNTYDCSWYGPNTMTGTLYLGALLAASRMAKFLGEDEKASEYLKLYQKGATKLDNMLWDGEYYVQKEAPVGTKQYRRGCLSDQLLGQWLAHVVGLGYLLPRDHVQKALASVYRYNFFSNLRDHVNTFRVYALGDESGLLNCTYPKGGRERLFHGFFTEVWSGVEYQVAAHLIYEGILLEGLSIVKSVRERHDGIRRNPWNEVEAGDHYARAMASWSVLLALSGYHYSAQKKTLSFAPKINADHFRCFWCSGRGWGTFFQTSNNRDRAQTEKITVLYGEIELKKFRFIWTASSKVPKEINLASRRDKKRLSSEVSISEDFLVVEFEEPVSIRNGETLIITVKKDDKNQKELIL